MRYHSAVKRFIAASLFTATCRRRARAHRQPLPLRRGPGRLLACLCVPLLLLVPALAVVSAPADGASRIVAVGDVHGDYDQFVRVLREAGLINRRNRWRGGDSTLVQLGDIPDRGPDSRKVMDLLIKLEKQAQRAGGTVHALIGNHEAMVMQGDLRYAHPGEYAAFAGRKSEALLDNYFEATVAAIKANRPEAEWPVFDDAYRQEWMEAHPRGYIELRQGFLPGGIYGKWVLGHDAVVRIGRTVFVHGGLSEAVTELSVKDINSRVRSELSTPNDLPADALILREDGPLWYRGLALLPETPDNSAMVDRVLAHYDADRIVIGHTPRLSAVLPRFGGKVLVVDVGLSAHYGSGFAWLEIEENAPVILHRGERLPVPTDRDGKLAYLRRIEALETNAEPVTRFIERWLAQPMQEPAPVDASMDEAVDKSMAEPEGKARNQVAKDTDVAAARPSEPSRGPQG